MARPRNGKLKLFKTVIGFHDAFVAASSQKAALAAWGASTDLFSAGLAERLDDPVACRAAFDDPGAVITAKRGSKGEWSKRAKPKAGASDKAVELEKKRAGLRSNIAALDKRLGAGLRRIDGKRGELRRERDALEARHGAARVKLQAEMDALDR